MAHTFYIKAAGFLLIAGLVGGFVYMHRLTLQPEKGGSQQVACTMEAKICPDGTSVGRIGPSCEFASCPNTAQATTTAAINQTITENAIRLTPLVVLEDSRCPSDVTCIWAGQVRVSVRLDAEGEQKTLQITLNKPVVFAGRTVTLVSVSPGTHSKQPISESSYRFTFKVTKTAATTSTGTLAGKMTIGPICPVERVDMPCSPTPEMYAARKVFVYTSDKATLVTTITPGADGTFSIALPAGSYYLDMERQGVGGTAGLPATILIGAGKITTVTIQVDTGIR